jgi:uncharacterized DUF497 family protein
MCIDTWKVNVEWDPAKAKANRRKHGVEFADAVTVLLDELARTIRDDSAEEDRFVTIGSDALGRVLVVYAWSEGGVRLIWARKASKNERRHRIQYSVAAIAPEEPQEGSQRGPRMQAPPHPTAHMTGYPSPVVHGHPAGLLPWRAAAGS